MKELSMTNDPTSLNLPPCGPLQTAKKRQSRAFWIKTLAEFSEVDLSVQAFCRLKKVSPSIFYTWRKRLMDEKRDAFLARTTFIPLEVMATDTFPTSSKPGFQNQHPPSSGYDANQGCDSGLTLHVTKNFKISIDKGFHAPTLKRVAQILSSAESPPC
jgi:hypothetical protein